MEVVLARVGEIGYCKGRSARLAQLDRASASGAEGRGFDSLIARCVNGRESLANCDGFPAVPLRVSRLSSKGAANGLESAPAAAFRGASAGATSDRLNDRRSTSARR